jgi:hypothetical protein
MDECDMGLVALFGSGETSPSAHPVYDHVLSRLRPPVRLAVLETPAGFELNSERVAGRVADYIREHVRNYQPEVSVIPARKRGTPFSPDDSQVVASLWRANALFLGPGSPTYAVRQLTGSLAWYLLQARHRLGASVILASAATVASSTWALPVYEIFKVGEDPHWQVGLDFLAPFGLCLTLVPHWNNQEGGPELDTSRCFMGQARFAQLLGMLPRATTVVGIDERTALILDCQNELCRVMGQGGVTLLREGREQCYANKQTFSLGELGDCHRPEPHAGIPTAIWEQALAVEQDLAQVQIHEPQSRPVPPPAVLALAQQREAARAQRDWAAADALRQQMESLGWQVGDSPEGPKLSPLPRKPGN